ncbi:MAG: hypothetical protein KIT17_26675 [Rubrivivax sp.]|nr:hypothetical protein [Rubrivivax sp.]
MDAAVCRSAAPRGAPDVPCLRVPRGDPYNRAMGRRLLCSVMAWVVAWVGFASQEVAWAAAEADLATQAAWPAAAEPIVPPGSATGRVNAPSDGSVQDHHLDDAPGQPLSPDPLLADALHAGNLWFLPSGARAPWPHAAEPPRTDAPAAQQYRPPPPR